MATWVTYQPPELGARIKPDPTAPLKFKIRFAKIQITNDNGRMGCTFLFECSRCGYRAKVSGGSDRGVHFAVQTIVCRDCRELYDAVTELKVPGTNSLSRWKLKGSRLGAATVPTTPPTFQAALNRLMFPGVKRLRWLRFAAACPVAANHRVETWQQPSKCPKCGYFLECNAVPFRRWE